MNLAKGLALLCGVIAIGIAYSKGIPLVLVDAPYWGFWSSTYTVNPSALAGVAAAMGAGYGVGKLAGQTGGTLIVEGIDNGSRELANKLKAKDKAKS